MKQCLFCLTLFTIVILSVNAQNQIRSGKVTYKFIENKSDFTEDRDDFFDKIHKQGEGVTFILSFTEKKSVFEIATTLENDITPIGQSWAENIVANGRYYTDLKENMVYRQTDAYGEKVLIKYPIDSQDWELTDEFKFIGKYKTFKAVKNKMITNSKGTFDFDIVAWYCPQIPGQFGPKEFNSLPGLILELKDTHFTFQAVEIKTIQKNIEIKPFKGKIFTQEEYDDRTKGINTGFFSPKNRW
ncbi:MAG: GLPGLI family protein [Muricauda sp.]|nr:GLPGLI family protein [Allomuricauda sp.]MBA4745112.1 GLPGLI family protein [Allomuricauda sp.]